MATVNYYCFNRMILAEGAVGGAGLRTYDARRSAQVCRPRHVEERK